MQQLAQDIQNQTFKKVYLLYGEETYLRLQYRDKLKKAMIADDDTMNYNYFEGKDTSIGEVIDIAETMPFFADRRVVVLENTGFVKSGGEKLAEYVTEIPDSVVLILVEEQIDKRSKLYKSIEKNGRCTEFSIQSDETLMKWIAGKMKKEGKNVTARTISVFLETVGNDMLGITTELEKLYGYTMGRDTITEEDIHAVCTVRLSNRIFDMIGYIADRRQKDALKIYHELLSLKESPFGILALISRQFNQMLQISDLIDKRMTDKQIGSQIGMNPYIVNKYRPRCANFTEAQMVRVIEGCAQVDHEIKKGNIDPELGVEMLIIEAGGAV